MSETVLSSQRKNGGRFRVGDFGTDVLKPTQHGFIKAPGALDKRYIAPISSAAFGGWVEFDLPRDIYLSGLYLSTALGALSSGNYCNYPGAALIDEYELKSGNNVIQAGRYTPTMRAIMSRMTPGQILELLNVYGSTSLASGTVISPIPAFFSRVLSSFKTESPVPFNANLVNGSLRLRLKLRSAADLAASGATVGTPTISCVLHVLGVMTDSVQAQKHLDEQKINNDFQYFSTDYQTLPQSAAVATATSTALDVTALSGSIKDIFLINTLVSNVDTAHDYLITNGSVTAIKASMDGKDYFICDQGNAEIEYHRLLFAELSGGTPTIGDPVVIPFAINNETYHYMGGLEKTEVNKLTVTYTHTAGANCYADIVAGRNVVMVIDGGFLKRIE